MKEQVNLQPGKRYGSPGKAQVPPIGKGPVVRQVNRTIDRAVEMGASDIHFEPYEERFRVRYRLDGVLQTIGTLSIRQKDAVISRIKIMADLDIAEKRRPQDGRIRIDLKVDSMTSVIEPLLIIIMGIILGFLIVAMYLPMFELMNVIG